MKDQISIGNHSNQGSIKDSNISSVPQGSSNSGPIPTGAATGTILIAPSTGGGVPMPMPIIPVVIGNGSPSMPMTVGGQQTTSIMVPMPPAHMNHQGGGGHDGGEREIHSYNGQQPGGPLGEQSQQSQGQSQGQQGNMKQIQHQMMRPQQQQQQQMPNQMPQQMQQQQIMGYNNSPIVQGGRPLQGQPAIQMLMAPQMYQNQPYYANPNQSNQGQPIMFIPGPGRGG